MTDEERIKEAIDIYIEKTCKTYGLTKEEAKKKIWVKLTEEYYKENPPKESDLPYTTRNDILAKRFGAPMEKTEINVGCGGGC